MPKITFGAAKSKSKLERKKSSSVANIDTSKQSVEDQISDFCGRQTPRAVASSSARSEAAAAAAGETSTEHSLSSSSSCSSYASRGDDDGRRCGESGGGGDSRRGSMMREKSLSCSQGLNKLSLIPITKKHSFTIGELHCKLK